MEEKAARLLLQRVIASLLHRAALTGMGLQTLEILSESISEHPICLVQVN